MWRFIFFGPADDRESSSRFDCLMMDPIAGANELLR